LYLGDEQEGGIEVGLFFAGLHDIRIGEGQQQAEPGGVVVSGSELRQKLGDGKGGPILGVRDAEE